ncbi:tRNA (adenosine(37)-N6)-threonylcarbamoyltransferase complex transferase subunit TsaD [Algirhabdus cladophorae]|uniref:tRNA (adenosine(37)-N6)-threonylcarbamoyltransferase complex transferase subunit TsaD n=1 Tax=Algirhabdus cladophorae TaxID=3377108 RepID=UPI003B84ADCE
MQKATHILGIESSCDDTAAAILRVTDTGPIVLSSVVVGQTGLHKDYGGVVPEIAARAHVERVDHCIEDALDQASLSLTEIDAIAATAGPGLIGGVLSGLMSAKALASALGKPLIAVNHLAGHALTPRLTDQIAYPYLMLLVSGGHCQFLVVHAHDDFTRLGGTIDDAPGEAFDKVAKLLGLPQPGGPSVQALAEKGSAAAFQLPRPLLDRPGCDMSFSGLKTAVLRARDAVVTQHGGLPEQHRADLCCAFQTAVTDVLAEKSRRALVTYLDLDPSQPVLAVAGGVAANTQIRAKLESISAEMNVRFIAPPLSLCTDNAAMIAYAGYAQFQHDQTAEMTVSARPRWPLDTISAPLLGSGKKGAKA